MIELALVRGLLGGLQAETLAHPYPPELATTIAGLLKAARGGFHACQQTSGGSQSYHQKPQSDLALTSTGKCSQLLSWTEEQQNKDDNILSYSTSISNCVDTLEHDLHTASTTSTSRSSSSTSSSLTLLPDDLVSPNSGPEPSALTSGPDPPAPTQPFPVTRTPPPPLPGYTVPSSSFSPYPSN